MSQVRDNSQMCSLTHRPLPRCGAGGGKRVCWDPVLTNPGLPLAAHACGLGPKGSGRDRGRTLVLAELRDPEEGQVW